MEDSEVMAMLPQVFGFVDETAIIESIKGRNLQDLQSVDWFASGSSGPVQD